MNAQVEPWMLLSFTAYLLAVLYIGWLASRRNENIADYFLANRTLGAWVAAISSTASSESGWVTLGAVGMAYFQGFSAIWFVPGCLLGYVFNWFFIAERLRAETRRLGSLTLPDYFADRFGGGRLLRMLAVLIILLFLSNYVAAQFTAAGKMFNTAFGMPYAAGVLLGAVITVGYTLMGGFRAVAWTDLLQGLLMAFGLVLLPLWTIFFVLGGPASMFEKLGAAAGHDRLEIVASGERRIVPLEDGASLTLAPGLEAAFLRSGEGWRADVLPEGVSITDVPPRNGTLGQDDEIAFPGGKAVLRTANDYFSFGRNLPPPFAIGLALGLLGIGFGYPGQPHVLTRYMSLSSRHEMRRARVIALTWGVLVYYGATFLGLAARAWNPLMFDQETAYMQMAQGLLHPLLAGVLIAAVFAAIGSTADSQLLVCASALAQDVYHRLFRTAAPEHHLLRISQATVLAVGAAATALALGKVRLVFDFVLYAWSGLGAAFGPLLILALYWRRMNYGGALASMLIGLGSLLYLYNHIKAAAGPTVPSYLALMPAFALAFLAGWLGTVLTEKES